MPIHAYVHTHIYTYTHNTENRIFICSHSPEALVERRLYTLELPEEKLRWETLGGDMEKWWLGVILSPYLSSHFS